MEGISSKASSNKGKAPLKRQKIQKDENEPPLVIKKDIDPEDLLNPYDLMEDNTLSSSSKARMIFQWLIAPLSVEEFYKHYWEKRPLHIKRNLPDYYNGWFSMKEMERIFREHSLTYGKDVDLTKYMNQKRSTLNPSESRAQAKDIWNHYKKGCSVRLLCPQEYCDTLWKLLSILEEEWGSMAGSNTYLTPPGTQGFAPHFDDIEAFLIQVEGIKHWKVYAPVDEITTLPRYSSPNLNPKDIGQPILDVTLEQGDLLYFPRGFIHQANAPKDVHSLHVTLSASQSNTYADLYELMIPQALASVVSQNKSLRRSLPRDYLNYMGAIHSDLENHEARKQFTSTVKSHLKKVLNEALDMLDASSDQMARNFIISRLPPPMTAKEEDSSYDGCPNLKITLDTHVRLLRQGIVRMTIEEGKAVVYHNMDNSRKPFQQPNSPLEFELDDAESIECLLLSYPEYLRVGDLPHEDDDDKIELIKALYAEGFLTFETDEE